MVYPVIEITQDTGKQFVHLIDSEWNDNPIISFDANDVGGPNNEKSDGCQLFYILLCSYINQYANGYEHGYEDCFEEWWDGEDWEGGDINEI